MEEKIGIMNILSIGRGNTGPRGHKGHIGYSSNESVFIKNLIDFRNEKYSIDIDNEINSKKQSINFESVDRKYDDIDKSIHILRNLVYRIKELEITKVL